LEIGIRKLFSNLWQQTQLGKDPIGPFLPVSLAFLKLMTFISVPVPLVG
jgi:hypothetical protein